MAGQPLVLGIEQPPGGLRFDPATGSVDDDVHRGDHDVILGRYPVDRRLIDVDRGVDGDQHHGHDGVDDGDDRNHDPDVGIEFDARLDRGVDVEQRFDLANHQHRLMSTGPTPSILFLCTGNASRSVMGAAALSRRRPDIPVVTAGTLVLEGLPMSTRTRRAMLDAGLDPLDHRSRQATGSLLAEAALVIAAAPEHVAWVRREHPVHAARTATLIHLVRNLSIEPTPLADRVNGLLLDGHRPDADEEIVDPGGGELDLYIKVAHQIAALVDELAGRL